MLVEIRTLPNSYCPSRPRRVLVLVCDSCKTTFEKNFVESDMTPKWGHFCSRKCYRDFRSTHPELYEECTASMHTEDVRQHLSTIVHTRVSDPSWVHPTKGKKLSNEACMNIAEARRANPPAGEKNPMFGKNHTNESREKMSETRTRKMISGEIRAYGKNGHVSGIYVSTKTSLTHRYRSSWEHAVMIHLDANSNVQTWRYESMRIPYYVDEHKRWYVPDFDVEFVDGRREVWEVKPKEFVSSRACQLKSEAAISLLDAQGHVYRILTRTDLEARGIL